MADPSSRVAQQLRPHVHLLSGHAYPMMANMGLEQAFFYLREAPSVVKQAAPMYWQYLTAPQDGTVWLEWLPSDKTDAYPSDGYVWADQETVHRQDYGGYTIELRSHSAGYRLGHEQVVQHCRTRYHLIAKNPAVNAPPPDPSLWIVHYHALEPSRYVNVSQIPLMPHTTQMINGRRWLEGLGRLERREFMLHDREKWPTINLPGSNNMQQGIYGTSQVAPVQMTQNRYQQPPHYPQQPLGPPSKRARTQGPGAHPAPGPNDLAHHDSTIEDEENTSYGDYFDHLSQRDISIARYTQHHRWMEEIFSSPYATHQIVPPDLGLGLMGELKGLTDGILQPPNLELVERDDLRPPKPEEAGAFTNLKQEQVDEFSKRVEKHLAEGKAEIERMKAEHARKMRSWKTVNSLAQAEKKLRVAPWAGHEDVVSAFRFEVQPANGKAEAETSKESVEDIVASVEKLLGVEIKPFTDATLITKGGLRERRSPPPAPAEEKPPQAGTHASGPTQSQQTAQPPMMSATNASSQSSHIAPNSADNAARTSASNSSNTQAGVVSAQQFTQSLPATNGDGTNNNGNGAEMDDIDIPELDDIDISMDIGEPNMNFDDSVHEDVPGNSNATLGGAPSHQPQAGAPAAPTGNIAGTSTGGFNSADQTASGNTFDDLNGGDDDEGGLIDFGGGMDDSAFGDAMHGME